MTRRFFLIAICGALLWCVRAGPSLSRQADDAADAEGVVWTAIIPDAFPRFVYSWRMSRDGTYREDGHDARTGAAIQATLSGHWNVDGARMVLRQQDQPYVFDGVVLGSLYAGTLTFDGRAISRFCAAKGDTAPEHCSAGPGVAALGGHPQSHAPTSRNSCGSIWSAWASCPALEMRGFRHMLDQIAWQGLGSDRERLEHDPEKCAAVFRKDHAQTRTESAMTIHPNLIAL